MAERKEKMVTVMTVASNAGNTNIHEKLSLEVGV